MSLVVHSLLLSLVRSQRNMNTLLCQHQLPWELRFPGSQELMCPCPCLGERGADQLAKLCLGSLLRWREGIRNLLFKNGPNSLYSRKKLVGGGGEEQMCSPMLDSPPRRNAFPC